MDTPSPGAFNRLEGISGVSTSDIWAVGAEDIALAIHWNGHRWTKTAISSDLSYLNAVKAIASNDVWAGGIGSSTDAAHWDGSAWTAVDIATSSGFLVNGIDAAASNDVWAVGSVPFGQFSYAPATAHWDGNAWTLVPPAPVLNGGWFDAVDVIAPNDVWAVGVQFLADGHTGQPLIQHWDGAVWSVLSSPFAGGRAELMGVSGTSTSDVWAVGWANKHTRPTKRTVTEHWDGTEWSIVPSVNLSGSRNQLNAVVALSPTNVWAAGNDFYRSRDRAMVEHWDGQAWRAGNLPLSQVQDQLYAATVIGNVRWVVGRAYPAISEANYTLAEASCGP